MPQGPSGPTVLRLLFFIVFLKQQGCVMVTVLHYVKGRKLWGEGGRVLPLNLTLV